MNGAQRAAFDAAVRHRSEGRLMDALLLMREVADLGPVQEGDGYWWERGSLEFKLGYWADCVASFGRWRKGLPEHLDPPPLQAMEMDAEAMIGKAKRRLSPRRKRGR